MDYEAEDLFALWALVVFSENKKEEWNEYRNKALELTDFVIKELEDYFESIFMNNIPEYTLPIKNVLYRARPIKSTEGNEIGVDIQKVKDDFFKTCLSDNEIEMAANSSLHVSLEMLFLLKNLAKKEFEESQLKKLDELIEKYSISQKFYGFSKDGCGVPPEKFRKCGRLNTEKDEYLYVTLEKNTAIYEMRPSIGQSYSLAACESNKELLLVDLRFVQWSSDKNFLLSYLAEKISEPNTDNDERFYHITQCLSHFLQDKNYDGIIYTSAMKKDGTNVMLFDEKNVDFISSEIISIEDINVTYATQFPLEKIE